MTQSTEERGLIVRHYEREAVEFPAEFVIADRHAAQVQFSAKSEAADAQSAPCTVVDVSPGGLGIESRYFLPRMLAGTIRVFDPSSGGHEGGEAILEHEVKVRRVEMIGREPRFAIGLSFTSRTPDFDRKVEALIGRVEHRRAADGSEAADA